MRLVFVLVLAACSFQGAGVGSDDGPTRKDAPTVDVPPVDSPPVDSPPIDSPPVDSPVDGTVAVTPFCDAAGEPSLVACWEFENTFNDASGDANDGTATNTTFVSGKVGFAVKLGTTGHIALVDTASLRPPAITLEGWINPSVSVGTRMGIYDNEGKYGFFLQPTGLQCSMPANLSTTVVIPIGQWTHVACTYDGATTRIYANGVEVRNLGGGGALNVTAGSIIALAGNSPSGDTLVGLMDQFRVWNVARTPQQICRAAGVVSCP